MLKQLSVAAFVSLLVFLGGTAEKGRTQEQKVPAKIRVVIIDGQNNHQWQVTTPHLKKVLEATGRFQVDVSTTPPKGEASGASKGSVSFPPDLRQYDAVLSNYNGAPWPVEFQKALEEYVRSGQGSLVIVHAANNAFADWPDYNRMIGMGWRGNTFGDRLIVDAKGQQKRVPRNEGPGAGHGPRHAFLVVVRDAEHPITKGMPREWMHVIDELYHGMRGPIENVHLLATALSDKKTRGTGEHEPMIWTVTYGKGRVFHTVMGHDLESMRCLGFIATLQRGAEWAATGKVTQPLPKDFPTAQQTSSLASN